ncbi:MAG TPA: lipoyl synthase [Phycisphaerales bacterium]|nr:lipoyl synthase [Phycisphaerales bacterium]
MTPQQTSQPTHPAGSTLPGAPTNDGIARTLSRHPRPLGGDPLRNIDPPKVSLSSMVLNNKAEDGTDAKQQLSLKKKPDWLRAKVPGGPEYLRLKKVLADHKLFTVCEEANCPNMGECWSRGVATIMILGDTCTRACGFCNVKTGRPPVLDKDEPRRVAESMRLMWEHAKLKHIVITSVNRDELADGGASIWAETIIRTRESCPGLSIEVLIPDFEGNWPALQMVIDARPHIINHNLETVRRMYPAVRPSAKFDRSLELLRRVKEQGGVAKTGIMVGIGERDEEVLALMDEVQSATRVNAPSLSSSPSTPSLRLSVSSSLDSTDILTIGQYLQPTRNHLPIDRWVTPDQFATFKTEGLARGFKVVESGALVRSSYHADHQADVLTEVGRERL